MSFIKGLMLGLTLQLSVGPVFFAVLHRSIKKGPKEALQMACGVTIVDSFYILISFTGIGALLKVGIFDIFIRLAGSFILMLFGISYFRNKGKNEGEIDLRGSSFAYGVKLTMTNPLTILFWSGIFGTMIASGKFEKTIDLVSYSSGCIASTILFLSVIGFTGRIVSKVINNRILKYMDYLVGSFLICFGIFMLFRF